MLKLGFVLKDTHPFIGPAKVVDIPALGQCRLGLSIQSRCSMSPMKAGRLLLYLAAIFSLMGAARTPSAYTSRKAKAMYEALAGGQRPSGHEPILAFFAGAYGTLIGSLPSTVLTGLAGAYSTVILILTSLFSEVGHAQLKSLLGSAPKALEIMCRSLSKRRVLQIEKVARVALSNPRFTRTEEERVLYEELSGVGLANPAVKFGRLHAICVESEPAVIYQELRTIASYISQGAAGFAASRSNEDRKSLEEKYPTKKGAMAALTFG